MKSEALAGAAPLLPARAVTAVLYTYTSSICVCGLFFLTLWPPVPIFPAPPPLRHLRLVTRK